MFKFLKDKLKGALSRFSSKVEEESQPVESPADSEVTSKNPAPAPKQQPVKKPAGKKEAPKPAKTEPRQNVPSKKEKKAIERIEKKEVEILESEKKILEEEKSVTEDIPLEPESKEELGPDLTEEVQKELEEERIEAEREAVKVDDLKPKRSFFGLFKKKELDTDTVVPAPALVQPKPVVLEEKKGFFGKITAPMTTKRLDSKTFDDLFWDLEVLLMENNVAMEVIEKIKQDLKASLVDKPLSRSKIDSIVHDTLINSINEIITVESIDVFQKIKEKKPLVICFVGINGSGKTTSIAKFAHMLQQQDLTCVLAAADTFRAAAIDQLQHHGDKLGIKVIKQEYGADPAAVAFDAIKHAEAKGTDVVLIDTAGRMHSNQNLIDEMKKIMRVAKPDLKIFVGESITGNDCIEQAKEFNDAVGIDGIILSKADVDEKGGAALSVSYVTKKPILFIGVGQEYKDLQAFTPSVVLEHLGL